jgi:ribonuclease HI
MALKLLLQLAQEHGVQQIQIFGDSLLVIKWIRKEAQIRNFTLQPLYDDIQMQMTTFSHISLSHIYRDMNNIVDGLSKDGLVPDEILILLYSRFKKTKKMPTA